ncbi:MAG: 50S ribosomal protein L24e [Thermoplasmata archaeon HGW-Thermoplasmata-2]|nr:MAG: 50S ribosomal protein L24e [Thermoplasmata archaeon HGW-Thermoplasmata-2]
MAEKRVCTFCGEDIEPGTGKMFVKDNATVLFFCSNKCQKNMLNLKRNPRRVGWIAKKK